MKMLMIICPEERQEEVRALIGKHDVHSYSEIANVLGEGRDRQAPRHPHLARQVRPRVHRRGCSQKGRTGEGTEGLQ